MVLFSYFQLFMFVSIIISAKIMMSNNYLYMKFSYYIEKVSCFLPLFIQNLIVKRIMVTSHQNSLQKYCNLFESKTIHIIGDGLHPRSTMCLYNIGIIHENIKVKPVNDCNRVIDSKRY